MNKAQDYDELLDTAMDFYNLTIGDSEVKISSKSLNKSKQIEIAGVRLRNAIKVQQELRKLDNEDSLQKS